MVDLRALMDRDLTQWRSLPEKPGFDVDPIGEWKKHAELMPFLALVARRVFAAPASTAALIAAVAKKAENPRH